MGNWIVTSRPTQRAGRHRTRPRSLPPPASEAAKAARSLAAGMKAAIRIMLARPQSLARPRANTVNPIEPNPPHRLAIAEGSVGRIHPGVSSGAQMNRADNRLPCRRALRLARPTLSGRASQDKTCAAVTAATDKQILARRMHPCNNCRIPGARPGKPEGYLPRSYRSSSITLVQAATKSFTKISFASELP